MKTILSLFSILFVGNLLAQSKADLAIRAKMIVHSDFTDFVIEDLKTIDREYVIKELASEGVFDCIFYKVTHPQTFNACSYYLCYSSCNKRFYRLSGFRTSEFNEFYNYELLVCKPSNGGHNKIRQLRREIFATVKIDEIDLKAYYSEYYKNFKNSLFDKSSCYRATMINKY